MDLNHLMDSNTNAALSQPDVGGRMPLPNLSADRRVNDKNALQNQRNNLQIAEQHQTLPLQIPSMRSDTQQSDMRLSDISRYPTASPVQHQHNQGFKRESTADSSQLDPMRIQVADITRSSTVQSSASDSAFYPPSPQSQLLPRPHSMQTLQNYSTPQGQMPSTMPLQQQYYGGIGNKHSGHIASYQQPQQQQHKLISFNKPLQVGGAVPLAYRDNVINNTPSVSNMGSPVSIVTQQDAASSGYPSLNPSVNASRRSSFNKSKRSPAQYGRFNFNEMRVSQPAPYSNNNISSSRSNSRMHSTNPSPIRQPVPKNMDVEAYQGPSAADDSALNLLGGSSRSQEQIDLMVQEYISDQGKVITPIKLGGNYVCEFCGDQVISKEKWRSHCFHVHGLSDFRCNACGAFFCFKISLKRHLISSQDNGACSSLPGPKRKRSAIGSLEDMQSGNQQSLDHSAANLLLSAGQLVESSQRNLSQHDEAKQ